MEGIRGVWNGWNEPPTLAEEKEPWKMLIFIGAEKSYLGWSFHGLQNWKENLGNRIGCVVYSATSQQSVTLDNLIIRFGFLIYKTGMKALYISEGSVRIKFLALRKSS